MINFSFTDLHFYFSIEKDYPERLFLNREILLKKIYFPKEINVQSRYYKFNEIR